MSVIYVTTQGACLRCQAGRYVVTHRDREISAVPEAAVEGVVLMGHVQVSTRAVQALLEAGVPLLYMTLHGRFRGMLQPGCPKNAFVRIAQYDASLDADFALGMARQFIKAKFQGQIDTLHKWRRNGWLLDGDPTDDLLELRRTLDDRVTLTDLVGLEAVAARTYFQGLGSALPPPFAWQGRHRRPPTDPVNALLSLTYMMVVGETVSACYTAALDPLIGFLHQLDYGRPSLALDILEPLRACYCDHLVMRLLQAETLSSEDFTITDEGCRLSPEGFREYLTHYETFARSARGERASLRTAVTRLARGVVTAVRERQPLEPEAMLGGDS
jgi:CRISPR-associated protein Cas1